MRDMNIVPVGVRVETIEALSLYGRLPSEFGEWSRLARIIDLEIKHIFD
jgi:hypothetical protein